MVASLALAAALVGAWRLVHAQSIDPRAMTRVFLRDGHALSSDGEYTVMGDRLVFVLPIGDPWTTMELQLVSLSKSAVDLVRTLRYAEALHAEQYAVTRGPGDYSALAADVTLMLAEIEEETDPATRLRMADDTQRRVAAWPAGHHNYRVADVQALMDGLDPVIDELRSAAGPGDSSDPPSRPRLLLASATEAVLPSPTLRESLQLALAAAAIAPDLSGRQAILRAVQSVASASPGMMDLKEAASQQMTADSSQTTIARSPTKPRTRPAPAHVRAARKAPPVPAQTKTKTKTIRRAPAKQKRAHATPATHAVAPVTSVPPNNTPRVPPVAPVAPPARQAAPAQPEPKVRTGLNRPGVVALLFVSVSAVAYGGLALRRRPYGGWKSK